MSVDQSQRTAASGWLVPGKRHRVSRFRWTANCVHCREPLLRLGRRHDQLLVVNTSDKLAQRQLADILYAHRGNVGVS